jgi:hypothetical protein
MTMIDEATETVKFDDQLLPPDLQGILSEGDSLECVQDPETGAPTFYLRPPTDNPVTSITLRDCYMPETDTPTPFASQFIRRCDTYTQISASRTDVEVLVRTGRPDESNGDPEPILLTGNHLYWTPKEIRACPTMVDEYRTGEALLTALQDDHAAWAGLQPLLAGDTSAYGHDINRAALALNYQAVKVRPQSKPEELQALLRLSALYRPEMEEAPAEEPRKYQKGWPKHIVLRKPVFLWDPYIARRFLTTLGGDSGCGKSTVASRIAARLSRGEHPYTGEPIGEPQGTLIATIEDDLEMMLGPRLQAYGANFDHITPMSEVPLATDRKEWERWISACQPALVIIDPIQEAFGGKLDENKASQTRTALKPFVALAKQYDCAFLFLAHLGKDAEGKKLLHRLLGSVDIGANMRSVLMIEETGFEKQYAITHAKNNLGMEGKPLIYRTRGYELAPGWVVGIADWEEPEKEETPQFDTKTALGIHLAKTFVKAGGGKVKTTDLLAHLEANDIKGGGMRDDIITGAGLHRDRQGNTSFNP